MCFSNFSISSIYKEKTSYRTLENRHRKMDFKFGFIDLELVYVRPLCCHTGTMNEISLVLLVLFCTFIEVENIKISFAVKFQGGYDFVPRAQGNSFMVKIAKNTPNLEICKLCPQGVKCKLAKIFCIQNLIIRTRQRYYSLQNL